LNFKQKNFKIKKWKIKHSPFLFIQKTTLVLLNRISGIFLKRHINILSLNVSESEIENVLVIVVNTTEKNGFQYCGTKEKE
jgi:hypothetical protein